MKKFNIPASPAVNTYEINNFLGADFTTERGQVEESKSPHTVNMVRSVPGKIRKRMGFEMVGNFGSKIYGVHYFAYADVYLVHVGNKLYKFKGENLRAFTNGSKFVGTNDAEYILFRKGNIEQLSDLGSPVYTGLNTRRSTALELDQKLIILDGKKALMCYADKGVLKVGALENFAKVPIVRIGEVPEGGGTNYEDFNLLTNKFEERFTIDEEHKNRGVLRLCTGNLANDAVIVEVLNDQGEWVRKTENKDFVVNREKGWIDFGKTAQTTNITATACDSAKYDGKNTTCRFVQVAGIKQVEIDYPHDLSGSHKFSVRVSYSDGTSKTLEKTCNIKYDPNEVVLWSDDTVSSVYIDAGERLVETVVCNLPVTPVMGEDNIRVVAAYKREQNLANYINHCTIGTLFGVNGAGDRLFISGNHDTGTDKDADGKTETYSLQNRDWYSGQFDPTYFPDTGYSELGSESSAIMGYSKVGNYLAAYKDGNEEAQTAYLRSGELIDDKPAFRVRNTLQGSGVASSYCFGYLGKEPVFFSKRGIFAVTVADITGDQYIQSRSYYLNGKLLSEKRLEDAVAVRYDGYYILCANNHLYMLDGLQPMQTSKNEPYATRQYAAFYCELGLDSTEQISYMWEMYGRLYFGTDSGKVYRFYNDSEDVNSYNDNGKAIKAVWETADIYGNRFYKNKTFRYIAMRVEPALSSSVELWSQKNGLWEQFKEEKQKTRFFDFKAIDFNKFSFSCDRTQKTITTKTRIKKVDKVRLEFVNKKLNEPLSISQFALEYTQGGNIK